MAKVARKKERIPISCDIVSTSRHYVAFLKRYRNLSPPVTDPVLLKNAVLRYEHCWLPLVAERRSNECLPPWDVYYVWHLHMLIPQNYKRYCERMYQRVIGHSFIGPGQQERLKRIASKAIWNHKYPLEPYDLTEVPDSNYEETRLTRTLCDFDNSIGDFHHQLR